MVLSGSKRIYRSVYMFIESAKEQADTVSYPTVRQALSQCLQGTAAEWFVHQLPAEDRKWAKKGLRLDNWEALLMDKWKMLQTKAL